MVCVFKDLFITLRFFFFLPLSWVRTIKLVITELYIITKSMRAMGYCAGKPREKSRVF